MLRFYGLRVLKDYIGHIILIGLPIALITLMVMINKDIEPDISTGELAISIGFIYIVMFQWFGSAYTFEGIEHDFFTAFKDRLRAAPVHPVKFIIANIVFGLITSYLQTVVILLYVIFVYQAVIPNLYLVFIILLLGAILAQLVAALCILWLKKASKAQALITVFIIMSMLIAGLFVPLPSNSLTAFLSTYSSPLAWTHALILDLINGQFQLILFTLIIISIIAVSIGTYKMSQKVTR
ncbi:MAG: ABC transporter permease [Bacillota bacterium]